MRKLNYICTVAFSKNEADSIPRSIINISSVFLLKKFKTSRVIPPLEKHRHVLVFQVSVGSTGANDSNFGPKQGGGDSEKTLSKLPKWMGRTKRQRVLKGFNDRGSGWNTMRQQVLYFAEFVINALNKYSSLFKQFLYYFNTFYYPPYSMK